MFLGEIIHSQSSGNVSHSYARYQGVETGKNEQRKADRLHFQIFGRSQIMAWPHSVEALVRYGGLVHVGAPGRYILADMVDRYNEGSCSRHIRKTPFDVVAFEFTFSKSTLGMDCNEGRYKLVIVG